MLNLRVILSSTFNFNAMSSSILAFFHRKHKQPDLLVMQFSVNISYLLSGLKIKQIY